MDKILASPKKNLIYSVEKPRLVANVTKQLLILKGLQTKTALATFEKNVDTLLSASIRRVAFSAYEEACGHIGYPVDATIGLRLSRENRLRATQAATWISATTGAALNISAAMSKEKALSEGRADTIAANELDLGFFGGTLSGWKLDLRAKKEWLVSDAHDKDDMCDDNEDDGPIYISDPFTSGHLCPPAHISCTCILALRRNKYVEFA